MAVSACLWIFYESLEPMFGSIRITYIHSFDKCSYDRKEEKDFGPLVCQLTCDVDF